MNSPAPTSNVHVLWGRKRLGLPGRRTVLSPEERRLADRIAREHGLPTSSMLSRSRYPSVARARHHFIAVLRWSTFMSYPELGALLGGLDHSTIMAAERRYDRELNGDTAPARAWPIRTGSRSTQPRRIWGCSRHPASDVSVPLTRGPKARFCHAYDAGTGRECRERLAPKLDAADALPEIAAPEASPS